MAGDRETVASIVLQDQPASMRPETEPPIVRPVVPQLIWTLVTVAAGCAKIPLATVQVCAGLEGCVKMVTTYGWPPVTLVLNVKVPFPVTVRLSPPLSCRVRPVVPFGQTS